MKVALTKSLVIKALVVIAIFVFGSGFFVYSLTLKKVDQKYKNQQSSGGSVSISTADLENSFVSIQGETGSPQEGNINLSGEIQGSSLTSNAQDGTSPLNVYSSTLVNNLNADMVDGKHAEDLTQSATQQTVNNITNITTGENIAAGTTSDYFRGDKTWQTLNKSAVGLSNVENTALSSWAGTTNITTVGTISGNLVATGTVNGATLSGGSISGGDIQGGTLTGTAVNGVTTADIILDTGSYADPPWITSLDKSKVGLSNVENTAISSWTGSANIATVGTITTGTWNAGAVTSSGAIQGTSLSVGAGAITSGLINGQTISSSANFNGTVAVATSVSTPTITTSGTDISFDSKNITSVGTISSGTITVSGGGNSSVNGNLSVTPTDGSTLITNGGFTGGTTGWSYDDTDWSYGTNNIIKDADGTGTLSQDVSDISGESYGPDLVTNGDFSYDPSGDWGGSGWTWNGSSMDYNGGSVYLYQNLTPTGAEPGQLYKVTFDASNITTGSSVYVTLGSQWSGVLTNGSHTLYLRTSEDTGWGIWVTFAASGTSASASIDNVAVKKVTGQANGDDYSELYKATFTVSDMTAGTFNAGLGGEKGSTISANGTYTQYLMGKPNNMVFSVSPSSTARFTIDDISVTRVEKGRLTVQDFVTKGPWVDVRAYGAVGDGITDDTAAIQAAHDSLPDTGGVLFFPPGTFMGHLVVKSNVRIVGSGLRNTILKLPAGANADVIQSKHFTELTGTDTRGGDNGVTIEDITLDGNKANNTSGYGVRKYGAMWVFKSVVIRECENDGLYTEWGSYLGVPPGFDTMEDKLSNIWIHKNNGTGFVMKGPHDTVASDVIIYDNWTGNGIEVDGQGGGLQLANSHVWGNNPAGIGMWVKSVGVRLSNVVLEGSESSGGIGLLVEGTGRVQATNLDMFANDTGIYLKTNDNILNGVTSSATAYGIRIGDGSTVSSGNIISGSFYGATAISWGNASNANNTFNGYVWTNAGQTAFSGTASSPNNVTVVSAGAGTNTNTANLSGNLTVTTSVSTPSITTSGSGITFNSKNLTSVGTIGSGAITSTGAIQGTSFTGANIYGSSSASGNLTLNSTSHATKGKIIFGTSGYDQVNNRLGVGTNAPSAKLDIQSTQTSGEISKVSVPSSTTLTGLLTGQLIDVQTNVTATGQSVRGQHIKLPAVNNTGSGMYFYSGSVIEGGALTQSTLAGSNYWTGQYINLPNITQTTGTVTTIGIRISGGTVTSGTPYAFVSDAAAGNFGIGTDTPDYRLEVNTDTANSYAASFFNDGNNVNRSGIRIQSGEDTPSGNNIALQVADGDGTEVGSITFDGTQTYFNTASDVRLKENIVDTALGMDTLMGIKVRDYNMKSDQLKRTVHGVVAQELLGVYPDAVIVPEDAGKMMMVDYSKLTPLIIKSIQEQQDQINMLSGGDTVNLKVKTAEVEGSLVVSGDATFKGKLTVVGKVIFDGNVTANQGVQLDTKGPKPDCNIEKRGTIWVTQGEIGVADVTEICVKNETDSFIWKKLD